MAPVGHRLLSWQTAKGHVNGLVVHTHMDSLCNKSMKMKYITQLYFLCFLKAILWGPFIVAGFLQVSFISFQRLTTCLHHIVYYCMYSVTMDTKENITMTSSDKAYFIVLNLLVFSS